MTMRKKNPFGKSNFDAPHAIYEGHGPWGHQIIHVIKTYQHPDNERKNPYAKWLIGAKTDMTYGSFDYGDTYVKEALVGNMKLVSAVDGWTDYYSTHELPSQIDDDDLLNELFGSNG